MASVIKALCNLHVRWTCCRWWTKMHTGIMSKPCMREPSVLLKKVCPKLQIKLKNVMSLTRKEFTIPWCQDIEPSKKEASLNLSVWLPCCPLSLERPWTVKLCRKNVASVNWEGEKKELRSFISGGINTNTNAMQTLLVLLALWILWVCWQYSRDQFSSTKPSMLNFLVMGTVKVTTFSFSKNVYGDVDICDLSHENVH